MKEAFNKQKQFIADASHELKTPLTIINTNADVLLSNSDDTIHNQSKWLHYIKSETERMTSLTNDLLYLTEMDDSRSRMIYSKFNLSDAVENIILTMEAVIFEKGIAPEHLARIFDRFYRTNASRVRKQGGYGLGLAIAQSIIEQHKGKIYAKSTVGESTTFYVHLS